SQSQVISIDKKELSTCFTIISFYLAITRAFISKNPGKNMMLRGRLYSRYVSGRCDAASQQRVRGVLRRTLAYITGFIRFQNVVELIIFSFDSQWLFIIYESSIIKSFVILWTILHWTNSWWISIHCLEFYMFSWCSRTGAFMELPTPDSFVRMFLQIMSCGPTWGKGSPHDSTVLHGICSARVEHCLILEPTIFRLHAGGCIRHRNHPAFAVPSNVASTMPIKMTPTHDDIRIRSHVSCFFTNLVEAFLYIGLLRSGGRRSVCRGCHLNAVGMAGYQNSDKSQNLVEEWPGMVAGVCEECRGVVQVYSKRKLNS
ncbi:hypothetical protein ALC62_10130, partial [Cyphomyrmex costatus]